MDDFLTSEAISISPDLMVTRLETLNELISNNKYIVITDIHGYLRYLPKKEIYKENILKLKVGDNIDLDFLKEKLFNLGYKRETIVSKTGEIAIRGFIIDQFLVSNNNPIRIEFFGDEIDSIRIFDEETQKSIKEINEIEIYPFTEFLIDKKANDSVIKKQKYLPYYSNYVNGIWSYLDDPVIFYYDYNQIITSYKLLRETILGYDEEVNDNIKTNYMYDIGDIKVKDIVYMMDIDNLIDKKIKNYSYLSFNIDNYSGDFEKIKGDLDRYILKGNTVVLCIDKKQVVKRIVSYLDITDDVILTSEDNIIKGKINIINKYITNGFIYEDYVVISVNVLIGCL